MPCILSRFVPLPPLTFAHVLAGEIQASFCTPSQMLVSSMTAMQVLSESRDTEEIWLARAAPRRWYAAGFSVDNGPTRYGNITFAVAAVSGASTNVTLGADFTQVG